MGCVTVGLYFASFFVAISLISSASLTYLDITDVTDIFYNSTPIVRAKYFQIITPDEIAFTIAWPLIFLWNGVGLFFIVVGILQSYSKYILQLTPPIFLVPYAFSFLMNIGWLFTYSAEVFLLSLGFLILSLVFSYSCQVFLCHHIKSHQNLFKNKGKGLPPMHWIVRVFIENGIALFSSWMTIATIINILDLVVYEDSFEHVQAVMRGWISLETASYIGLGVIFLLVLTWFCLENYFWVKHIRYCFATYAILILYFSGVVYKQTQLHASENNIILIVAVTELAFCVLALLLRIILFIRTQR